MSITETPNASVDARLAQLGELQAQFNRVRDRLRRAEEQKGTVTRRTFDKVRAEYDRELDALRAQMTPLREELESHRTSIEDALEQANGSLETLEEELAEAVFRHRVGEYTDAELAERRRVIETRLNAARSRMTEQRRSLDLFAAMEQPSSAKAAEPEPDESDGVLAALDVDTHEETAVTPEPVVPEPVAAVRRPVLRTPSPAAAPSPPPAPKMPAPPRREPLTPASSDFENPHDWIKEMGKDTSRPAEPRPANVSASRSSANATATRRPARTPSLVFVNGPHVGESFPLLPTTLTIGREHDNNVELKDPDVARYHARIVRERGNYVIEDLDSATGTWVNGKRTRRSPLNNGDVVRVGSTEIAIDFEWSSDPS